MESDAVYNSLTKVEYLITFNAFIYGYIVSRFFSGWGKIISNRNRVIFSVEHILWSFFAFCMLVSLWWYSWLDMNTITDRSISFYASIISPFIMYMISSLYFRDLPEGQMTNLGKDSKFQRKQSAALYFILYLFNLVRSWFSPYDSGNWKYFIIALVVCVVAFYARKRWLGQINLAIGFIVITIYMFNIPSYYNTDVWSINNFSFSEYLTTFITFVYGFIVAKYLEGWTFFLKNRRIIRFNVTYILWTLLVFGLMIDYWWGLYQRSIPSSRSFGCFMISLLVPIGFYLLTAVLFNDVNTHAIRSQDNFRKNRKVIFLAFISIFFFDFIGSLIFQLRELIHLENLFLLIALGLSVVALVKENVQLQRAILVFGWILLIAHNLLS